MKSGEEMLLLGCCFPSISFLQGQLRIPSFGLSCPGLHWTLPLSLLFLAFRPFLAAFWVVVALGFLAHLLALPFFGDFESLDKASFLLVAAAGFFHFSLTKLRNSLAELERAGRTGTPSLYQDSLAHQAFETQLDATVVFLHIVTCG